MITNIFSPNLPLQTECSQASKIQPIVEQELALQVVRRGIIDIDYEQLLKKEKSMFPIKKALNASQDLCFDEKISHVGIEAFKEIKNTFEEANVTQSYAFATEAFRQGSNAPEFVARIAENTGVRAQVLSQEDEAVIAFQ